jgi:hypothetical protein
MTGGRTWRLNVPANAPVKQYWPATFADLPQSVVSDPEDARSYGS